MVSIWYHLGVAMTLRIEDEELAVLREQAELENRSMQQVVRVAIREYVARHRHEARVNEIGRRIASRDAGLLRRLADS
jgi:predicted transcriptional regulator